MDKSDFIRLYQMARKNAATQENIMHAWQKSELFSIEPQIVLDKLGFKTRELETSIVPIVSCGDSVAVPPTPVNVKQVDAIVQEIKAGNLNPSLSEKLGKACSSALANNHMLRVTNDDLIKADQRKKDKAARGQAYWGEAQVMNLEVVQQRLDEIAVKELEVQFKRLCRMGPDLFEDNPQRGGRDRKGGRGGGDGRARRAGRAGTGGKGKRARRGGASGRGGTGGRGGMGGRGGRDGRSGRGGRGGRVGRGGKGTAVEQVIAEEAVEGDQVIYSRRSRLIIPKKQ